MATLRITKGPDVGKTFQLRETQIIGRLRTNEIAIADEAASRRHARLYRREGQFAIVDLGSANGILLDGEKVERTALQSGVRFTVGMTTFEINYEAAPAPQKPAVEAPAARGRASDPIRTRGKSLDEPLRSVKSAAKPARGPLGIDIGQLGPLARTLLYAGVVAAAAGLGFLAWWISKPA